MLLLGGEAKLPTLDPGTRDRARAWHFSQAGEEPMWATQFGWQALKTVKETWLEGETTVVEG